MRVRKIGSSVTYGIAVVSGVLGVGLCCFFGFGETSSPGTGTIAGYVLLGVLMALLIAFGYRGIAERRKFGNEIWWQLLIAGLIWAVFLALLVLFIFTYLAILSGNQTTVF